MVFTLAGIGAEGPADMEGAARLQDVLAQHFHLHWGLFLVPAGVIALIARKVPPVPALFLGVLGGAVAALIAQPDVIRSLGADAIGPALGLGETYLGRPSLPR